MSEQTHGDMSVAELQRLLNNRKLAVNKMRRKRDGYLEKAAALDAQIKEIEGEGSATNGRTGARQQNEKALHVYVREILGKHKKGLPLADLAEKVLKAGYKTNSVNFNNTVYQCVYKAEDIQKDEAGNYYLA